MNDEAMRAMSEAHADFIKDWYKAVFEHGYKHGYEDAGTGRYSSTAIEVSHGESEILFVKCPVCGGDGFYRFPAASDPGWMCINPNCEFVLRSTEKDGE